MNVGRPETRLLVASHQPEVRTLIAEKLQQAGFVCILCSSGTEALFCLAGTACEAMIVDLHLPGISGLSLVKEVSAKYPRIVNIIVTGEADIRIGIAALKQGADDFLVGPYELGAVVASIERALDKKHSLSTQNDHPLHLEQIVEERTRQFETARQRIEYTYDETLEALGAALDTRDTETEGHSRRVSRYSLEMGRAFGCPGERLKHIARGSYLHDIGKIGIPDSILLKPGKLTKEETEVMQTHSWIGYQLVRRIAFLAPAAEIVLTHQERHDGTGYPQGLLGEEIPLGSRFFAVADTLDAMTSDRPYRRALPFTVAREEILRESGRQFAPEAVEIFSSLPETLWEDVRQEVEGLRSRYKLPHPSPS
jgi:response regulator RpfG family c-di-GMP phosphodiesterase